MTNLVYAGIGTRATPANVLADMTVMARSLAPTGWHLSSSGGGWSRQHVCEGASAGQRTIWLPWRGHSEHRGTDCRVLSAAAISACMGIAAGLDRCSPAVSARKRLRIPILLDAPEVAVRYPQRGPVPGLYASMRVSAAVAH